MSTTNTTWDDVLDVLMEEDPNPDYATLKLWCARYPRFTDRLASYFAVAAEQEALDAPAVLDEDRLRNQAVSRAIEHWHSLKRQGASTQAPMERLTALMRAHGVQEEELAARCRLDLSVILKLDRRRIAPFESIPTECFQMLGKALDESWLRIREMICGPPMPVAVGGTRKSRGKAQHDTQTFELAVKASSLSNENKQFWIVLVKAQAQHP
jgi:hypothetical protein